MTSALVGGAVLSATGLGFWIWALAIGDDTAARLSDLGSALLGGAVVAFAIFILERQFEQRAAAQDRERERAAERQALRLTLGVQPNLRGVDLSKLDLVRFSFNGKSLENANFSGAKLERATFVGATLAGAQFVNADLTRAVFSSASLGKTTFALANVSGALFTEVHDLDAADFTTAYYYVGNPPVFAGDELPGGLKERSA